MCGNLQFKELPWTLPRSHVTVISHHTAGELDLKGPFQLKQTPPWVLNQPGVVKPWQAMVISAGSKEKLSISIPGSSESSPSRLTVDDHKSLPPVLAIARSDPLGMDPSTLQIWGNCPRFSIPLLSGWTGTYHLLMHVSDVLSVSRG